MAIRDTQRRVTIIVEKDDYDKIVSAAKHDRRSVSSYCNNVIMTSIESNPISCVIKKKNPISCIDAEIGKVSVLPYRRQTFKIKRSPKELSIK